MPEITHPTARICCEDDVLCLKNPGGANRTGRYYASGSDWGAGLIVGKRGLEASDYADDYAL